MQQRSKSDFQEHLTAICRIFQKPNPFSITFYGLNNKEQISRTSKSQ